MPQRELIPITGMEFDMAFARAVNWLTAPENHKLFRAHIAWMEAMYAEFGVKPPPKEDPDYIENPEDEDIIGSIQFTSLQVVMKAMVNGLKIETLEKFMEEASRVVQDIEESNRGQEWVHHHTARFHIRKIAGLVSSS
jgi:hypothetical protein